MENRVYFITGTGTGVGKTFAAAALACALRLSGKDVGVMKPVESGCADGQDGLVPADALFLKEAAGADDPLELINPYRFRLPVAPNVAAKDEGVTIKPGHIRKCLDRLKAVHEVVIVEGAGGLLSPVFADTLSADLALYLDTELIIVAPNALGVINHTLMTVEAASARKILVKGVLLNSPREADPADASLETNAREIERLGKVRILGSLPFFKEVYAKKGAPRKGGAFGRLLESAASCLDPALL